MAEKQYMDAFNDELESFKDRIRKRAQAKIEEAMRQVEEVSSKHQQWCGGLERYQLRGKKFHIFYFCLMRLWVLGVLILPRNFSKIGDQVLVPIFFVFFEKKIFLTRRKFPT